MVCQYIHDYVTVAIPGIYFLALFDLNKRFLNCMYITWVQIMAEIVGSLLHVALCFLIVFKWNMDVNGLGIVYLLTNLTKFLFVTCYSNCPYFTEL